MNELDKLLEDYSIASDTPTEVIKTSLEQEGENYVSFMQDYLKKKDNPNQNLAIGNPQSEMDLTTSVPISQDLDLNQAQIQAMNQVENPTLQSSDILPQQDSTDLPLIQTASSGLESSNTSQPTFKPFDSGVIANPITTNQSEVDEYNRYVQNRNRSITPSTINATQNTKTDSKGRKAIFSFGDDEVLDVLAGKPNDIQGDITPRLATQEELDADNAKILEQENQFQLNSDKETQDFFDKYLNKSYNVKLKEFKEGSNVYIDKNIIDNSEEYVNRILEKEKRGEVKVARNDKGQLIDKNFKVITDNILWQPIGKENIEDYNREVRNYNSYVSEQNIDSARFNQGNIGNEPEQDSYGEFVTKANDLGVLLSNEDSENITTYEDRQNFLATLEATNNAQKNGTTLQSELDKLGSKYLLSEEDKIANGYDGINLITNGIKDGKVKDKEESDFFNKFFTQKENVLDFGEYWNNEGKAKYGGSQVRENQANYQNYRANIFNDFLSYKNDKYGTDMRFIEEAVTKSSNLADKYYADGDFNAANVELAKVEKLYNQYNNNEANRQNISNIYTESNKAFTTYNKQKKEEAEFQLKVENGEFVANAKNILGQVALGIGSSVTSTITGLGRIVSSALPSDNLKDGLDIISDTELKVGNVKVASLTNKIKEFVGSDGLKYKEINGVTYLQNSDGKLSKNGYVQSGNEKVTKEDVEYNYGAGLTFVTSKMGADILITNAVGGGINRVLASSSTRLSNLKNIEKVFGLDSQVAKNAQSFAKLAKNTDNISVTGWYVQMYNDSYKMAEEGGINGNVNKHIYAMTQSLMQSVIQRINPDINFLKSMNTESRQIVRALMTNNKDKAIQLFSAFAKKAGNNVAKETGEEVIQQVVQDFNNVVINKLADTQLATTDAQGYKEVVFATVVPSIVASLMGGKGSRIANINNKEIDLTTYSRLDLITELARDKKGIEIVKDFKDTAYFPSQKQLGTDLENQIITAQKQIAKIPESDKYSTSALSEATPILQEIERKKETLKTDDGTFSKKINEEIDLLVTKVNSILDNDLNTVTNNNAETTQSTPQSEAVQEQTAETRIDLNAKTGEELYVTEENSVEESPINTNQNETQEEQPEQVVAESSETPENITNETDIASVPQQDENSNQVAEDVNEDDIILPDDALDLINSLSLEDEATQRDNIATDGNVQPTTDIVQQQGENNDTKTTTESTTSEGKVEVAPTETQATVLTEAERGRNDLVGMKTAYNKLSKAKKNQEDGKLMFARINELGKKLGYPIGSMGDGKISIKNPKTGKEMAKVKETFPEKIPTKKEVATAKKHLEDVAVWDGNTFNDQWETDLTWAEIRRGKQDIDNGKLSTVPARRLVNEINRQINDYGGFNFTKGAGQITDKTLISLQEIEDSKQQFPKVWNNLDLLTTQELENLYNERAESEADFYKNRALQDENNSVYEDRQEVQEESNGDDKSQAELNKPIYLGVSPIYDYAKKITVPLFQYIKETRDGYVSKEAYNDNLDKDEDTEFSNKFRTEKGNIDIYIPTNGVQKGMPIKLSLEQVNEDGGIEGYTKITVSKSELRYSEDDRMAYYFGDGKFKSLENKDVGKGNKTAKKLSGADFENANANFAQGVALQSTTQQFTPITQKAYDKLVDRLLGVFKKFGGKVETDLDKFKARAKELGFSDSDVDFMISRSRLSIPKVRGGWTKEKIIKYLKSNSSDTAGKLGVLEAIASYDTFEDFKDSIYYHGTTNFIPKGLKPSITMSEAEAERNGGGGYGERYYGVSLTKNKKTAESFSGQSNSVTVYPVLLKKDANIIVREDLQDANEVEEIVVDLYEQGVDAVWIGGGEQELVVINPKASMLYKNGRESFQVYGGFKSTQPTDAELKKVYEKAKEDYKEKSEQLKTKNGKEEREAFLNSIDNVQFMKAANGEIYGAKLPDGTIYLNPEKVNANTPIHEFSHLWQQLMPTRFKKGVEILKNTPIGKKTFAELKQNEGYANKSDAELWNEALVTVMGNEGERIFNSSKASKLKTWITDLFKSLGNAFGIRNLTPVDNLSVFVKGALKEVMGDKEIFAENGLNGNGKIDFQIIGEKGASQLSDAENIMANNKIAKEMESDGKDAKTIRLATGWEKGVDGKWRYEIEDIKLKVDGTKYSSLGNIVDAKELFQAYPNLKDIDVIFNVNSDNDDSGSYTAFEDRGVDLFPITEEINVKAKDIESAKLILIHEIQHAIQYIEGFAIGGNYSGNDSNLDSKQRDEISKIESKIDELNSKISYLNDGDSEFDEVADELDYYVEQRGNFYNDVSIASNRFNRYKRLAGETESRNTETRSNISIEERKQLLLSETEDIPRDEQIQIFEASGIQQSVNKNPKPTYLMPKSLIEGITSSIRNGGKSDEIIALAKDSKWFNSLSEKKQNEFSVNDVKQILVDSVNYYKGADAVKLQETKDKAKAKLDKEKSESKAKEKASREKLADVRQESKDKIIKLRDKYKEKIAILRDENKDLRTKRFERKAIVRETIYELKSLLIGNNIDGRVTPSEISRLIRLASEVGASSKPTTALDTLFKEYAKIQEKAEARMEVQKNKELTADEYNQLKDIVEELLDKKTGTETIKDLVKTLNLPFSKANSISKEVYTTIDKIIARYETNQLSDEESADLLKDAYQQSKDNKNKREDERTKIEKVSDGLKKGLVKAIEKYSDRQFKAKELLNKIGALNTYNRLINSAGSSAKANELHTKIYDKVFKGLSNDARVKLNQIIVARRIIAIEKNRAERDLSPINHTNNITLESAEKALKQFESENKAEYDDLIARSKGYFKAFDYQLDQMLENGLITQEAYNGMKGVDYQPRMFLEHIADYQGNVEDGIGGTNYNTAKKGVDSKVIQSLDEGSIGKMVMDADWILRVAIASNTKMSAMNEVNMVFITKELPLAQAKYDLIQTVDADKRTKEDVQFIKYFENLRSQVKENPIMGYSRLGNPIFELKETPQGFTKNYFYIDGVRNEFFLADELHNIWNDIYEKRITKEVESNVISKTIFTAPTKLTKLMATGINPLFFIVNTPRDFFQIVDFSEAYSNNVLKGATTLALDTFKAYKDTMMHDKGAENTMYAKYIEYGGGMDFLATQGKFDKKYADKNKILSALDTINTLSKYSEIGFRIATFSRATQNGLKAYNKENGTNYKTVEEIPNTYEQDNIYHNAVRTARAVMDFNQGGKTAKDLDSMLPYLNASIQGTRSMVDAMRKRPYETSFRMAQTATYMTGLVFGLMAGMFSLFDDDDDEKGSMEKIIEAYSRITPTQRANSWNIVLPNKVAKFLGFTLPDKKDIGEYYVLKIAKTQALSPLLYTVEEGFLNVAKLSLGKQQRSYLDIGKEAKNIANNNLLPFELANPTDMINSLVSKNFLGKAYITSVFGYDTYRKEKLSADIDQVPRGAEGLGNPNVEDFYKDFGKATGYSPVRTKAIVEGLITSPQTNPYVMATYTGLNVATNAMSKEDKEVISDKMVNDLKRMATGRLISQTSQYAKSLSTSTKNNKEKFEEVDYAYAERRAMVKELSTGLANGTMTKEYADQKVNDLKLTPNETKNLFNQINERLANKNVDSELFSIKYDRTSAEGKALRLIEAYPNINLVTDRTPEALEIKAQIKQIGGIATDDVNTYYKKLIKEREEK